MTDLHVHTRFSDGADVPEDIVKEAIEKGMDTIGFSDHSYTFFDACYCMTKANTQNYIKEINYLKEKYAGKIKILLGIELDYYSDFVPENFDYIIGSVHYLKLGEEYCPVDENVDMLDYVAEKHFGGDFYSLCEEYFKTVSDVLCKTNADIIGHFDLISKFNEKFLRFDTKNERYINAYKAAVDQLIPYNKPFEVNTGAISRRYKTLAYPDIDILKYIKEKGGKVILSSDSHKKDTLCSQFTEYEEILKKIGF